VTPEFKAEFLEEARKRGVTPSVLFEEVMSAYLDRLEAEAK
jgi:hypothetical protein